MAEETVRLRLLFEEGDILSKSQNQDGLERSWLLLKPQHSTISDFASYIVRHFHLQGSCPNGLLLCIGGFVLPHFESARIITNGDIICVKKRKANVRHMIKGPANCTYSSGEELMSDNPLASGVKLLANEEFEKEIGGYETDSEEGGCFAPRNDLIVENVSLKKKHPRKRKAQNELNISKRKRKHDIISEDGGKDTCAELGHHHSKAPVELCPTTSRKSSVSGHKSDDAEILHFKTSTCGDEVHRSPPICDEITENEKLNDDGADVNKKRPSRSARRKKAKRKWLRELAKVEKDEVNSVQVFKKEIEKTFPQIFEVHNHSDESRESSPNVIPVVVKPGHIRFEPVGKEAVGFEKEAGKRMLHWNGITTKRKGQKWGQEKSFCTSSYEDDTHDFSDGVSVKRDKSSFSVDFDTMSPLISPPKAGDVIAYRLIELSDSWAPEVSSFRVGEISSYEPEDNKVTLFPVADYPISSRKCSNEAASISWPDNSPYKDDGTLVIDYASLLDVRLIKANDVFGWKDQVDNMNAMSAVMSALDADVNNGPATSDAMLAMSHNREAHAENGGWEEIVQTLGARKADLSHQASGGASRPYRALRSSGLAQTLALLRATNDTSPARG